MVGVALGVTMAKLGAKLGGRLGPKGVAAGGIAGLAAGIAIQNGGLEKARQFLESTDLETERVDVILEEISRLDVVQEAMEAEPGPDAEPATDEGYEIDIEEPNS